MLSQKGNWVYRYFLRHAKKKMSLERGTMLCHDIKATTLEEKAYQKTTMWPLWKDEKIDQNRLLRTVDL
jgi:hypothetical protein